MFNSFLSKFKTILESDKTSVKVPTKPSGQEKAKATIKEKETDKSEDLNRVVFSPQKSEVKEEIPDVKANIILENAHRIEAEVKSKEAEIKDRLHSIEDKEKYLFSREQSLDSQNTEVKKKLDQIDELYRKQLEKLENISGLDINKAKELLMSSVEKKMANWVSKKIDETKDDLTSRQEEISREILSTALTHGVTDYVAEYTVSTISLPDEKIKGKIIGREGRNIRAFEQATGVDVIVDDTPEAVTVSCFDSVRREIARRTLTRLVNDGRIHPAYIEKILEEERKEMDEDIAKAGKDAVYEAGVHGLHPEVVKKLGRLKYRTSYGQNQLAHAVETSKIASILAAELGADVEVTRTAALLHDLGKAMDHNSEGTHALLGAEFARRHGVNPKVVNAIASHHHETDQESIEAILVEAADAISGARPGARREDLEQYIKRLKALETVANNHEGVEQSYAIQAGREVRIIVKPEEIDDYQAHTLAKDIANEIEQTMQYPGQIQVTVIRETRSVSYAK